MRKRAFKTGVILFAAGAGLWALQSENEIAEYPRASLRFGSAPSVSVPGSERVPGLMEESPVSQGAGAVTLAREFESKTRGLLKLSTMNELIAAKLKVEYLIRQESELASRIPEIVRTWQGTSRAKLALINSLAEVDSPESVAALLQIAGSENFDAVLRMQAIVSSRELTAPDENVVSELWRLTDGRTPATSESGLLNVAALLSLGSIASALPEERAEQIVRELNAKLESAEAEGSKTAMDYIDALGNSGSPRVIEIAGRYVLSPLPEERALGASILRKTRDVRADHLLLEILDTDEAAEVRREAVQAASFRKLDSSSLERFSELVLEEPDSGIRLQMIELLKNRVDQVPVARQALERLFEVETDENNRAQISAALRRSAQASGRNKS